MVWGYKRQWNAGPTFTNISTISWSFAISLHFGPTKLSSLKPYCQMSHWPYSKIFWISMWNGLGLGLNFHWIFNIHLQQCTPIVLSTAGLNQHYIGPSLGRLHWCDLATSGLFVDHQKIYCLVIFLVSDSIVWWFFLSVTILFDDLRCQCTNYWWFSLSVTVLFGDIPCQCTNSFVTRSKCWTSTSSVSKPLPPPLLQLLPQIPIQFCFSDLYHLSFLCGPLWVNHQDNRGI